MKTSNKDDNKRRCYWCEKDDLYREYHDNEWGIPSRSDQHLFEHLILETFQAGLSWHTILKKRENFRKAFDQFDALKMAKYDEPKVESLLLDAGIIRNRQKINAAINSAQMYLEIANEYGSFSEFMWSFVRGKTIKNSIKEGENFPVTSLESDEMSKALKKRGFKFVGSTTCYAYMQAVGMINDHFSYCWKKEP